MTVSGWAIRVGVVALAMPMAAVAQPAPGAAQPRPSIARTPAGFYVAAGIGVNMPQSTSVDTSSNLQTTLQGQGSVRFEPMAMGVMALGYGFGNGIRVELEGSLRANAVDRASAGSGIAPVTHSQGQAWNWGVMTNALVDIDLGANWIQPYLGLGLGYVWTEMRDFGVNSRRHRLTIDESQGNLAYQAIVGAAFPIGLVPGLSATAEYRFLGTMDQEFSANFFPNGRRTPQAGRAEISPYHHSILFGLRYALGTASEPPPPAVPAYRPPVPLALPPPPSVAAVPAPVTRSYIVYFGLNSASLTARARQVVAEAAQSARGGVTRIELSGHADASGTATTNRRLSRQRAEAVASELRRRGVARDSITITAHGEAQPAIPTGSAAREPRNRRVEIVIR